MQLSCAFLDHRSSSWAQDVDQICTAPGPAAAPWLFPPHFLKATFPQIGGHIATFRANQRLVGIGFLFPRDYISNQRAWTLRLHQLDQTVSLPQLLAVLESLLPGEPIVLYHPQADHAFAPDHQQIGEFDIGAPTAAEAAAIRRLQQQLWGSSASDLYPADAYGPSFRPGTALVARHEGQAAGFLLGCYRFGTLAGIERLAGPCRSNLCIESQLLGVAPEWRRAGLGLLLKRRQAVLALEQGIDLIHWTVDPLQATNAALNFGRLGAVAGAFYADYYPFRNELNRVSASRFGLVWPLRTARVQRALASDTRQPLQGLANARRINDGPLIIADAAGAPSIAIEIPADWTTMQRDQPALAMRWRTATDMMFAQYVGMEPGRYVVADVAAEGDRRYLIAYITLPAPHM